jgi:hypothetical protein
MTVCPHTGLTIPECSCQACVQRQLADVTPLPVKQPQRHSPISLITSRFGRRPSNSQ